MTEDEAVEAVEDLLEEFGAIPALRILDAARKDFLEWGSETGTLKGGEMRNFNEAQATAAAVQGLGPAYMLLREAGIEVALWNSGGWTMILTVPLRFLGTDRIAGEVWITGDMDGEDALKFDVSLKRARYVFEDGAPVLDEMGDEDEELVSKDTDNLVDHVRHLVATFEPNDGIERQWVDTNDLSDGMPRVLTFDECAMRGLDGTGRTTS